MSKFGLQIAKLFGKKLPKFSNQEQAEQYYFVFRDKQLALLENISKKSNLFNADYSVESLKDLECWYFDLYETNSFDSLGINRETFEKCMSIYFGEVAYRNDKAEWIVEEYAFENGKYELGIRKGLLTIMLGRFVDHFETPNNKRKQYIFRQYKQDFT